MEINLFKYLAKKLLFLVFVVLVISQVNNYAMAIGIDARLDLTVEEKEYIRTRGTIVAATIDGGLPFIT